ncbi:MAG TPA: hypothetical protein VG456_24585 [Candidatus Sulfopaludibacter sp.]|jgi:hypothetical protein|nr:hypothetical protein [Candidatus Sulfopaludibacter sp.]
MSTEITRKGVPAKRRLSYKGNTITFPRELRDAIPDLPTYSGRVLELESIDGAMSESPLFGRRVHLKMQVTETGKLSGKFTVRVDLQADAARALADTLLQLAAQLES